MINPFFRNNGPFKISDILQLINIDDLKVDIDKKITDIKDLLTSKKTTLLFFILKSISILQKILKLLFA